MEETPLAEPGTGNTAGTYLKTLVMSTVLGMPLGVVLGVIVGLPGLVIGAGIAVWVSARAFRLEGLIPYLLVLVSTVVVVIVVGFAILAVAMSRMGY